MSHIAKGTRIVVSFGAYSDYSILALAEATEDFDIEFVRKEFKTWLAAKNIEDVGRYHFLTWLTNVRKLLVEVRVDWTEWHLGDYTPCDRDYEVMPWRDAEAASDWDKRGAIEDIEKALA